MKIKYTLPILSLLLASCVSLDEKPESSQVTSNFYRNASEAEAAVNAIYNALVTDGDDASENLVLYHGLFQPVLDAATDDYAPGPKVTGTHLIAIGNLVLDPSNPRFLQLWRESYDLINRANVAIDHILEINDESLSDELKARYINEAKFLRALNYFNLVRIFGGVPILLHETSTLDDEHLYVSRATEDEVYDQIIKDLKDAESLPAPSAYSAADAGRATGGSAKGILAKVYLTRQDWSNAAQKAKELIDLGWYDLFEDFSDVFSLDHKNGKEHLFSVSMKGNANFRGNILAYRAATYEVPGVLGNYTDMLHTAGGLYESFDKNDKRLPVTFVTEMVSPTNGKHYTLSAPHFNKYYDETVIGNQGQSSKDIPVLRYADVLLMYAEAINELNGPTSEAYQYIDKVRARAGISLLADIAPGLSKDAFRDSVFQERRHEFVYEQQRWFDLTRRGADYYVKTLHAAGKTGAEAKHIHFPIPLRETEINPNLKQSPEWE